jgi:Fe-S-cluster containining protein
MGDGSPDDALEPLDAGPFSSWLEEMRAALRGERDATVPCDGCTACCRSSQFVTIAPDETDALAHIPSELQFPAPRLPRGHVVLGYDSEGRCPMLGSDGCTIYEHRPRACRTYDCRIFAATGITLTTPEKAAIAARVRRWRFSLPTSTDDAAHGALRATAARLRAEFPNDDPTHLAVRAVELDDPATA